MTTKTTEKSNTKRAPSSARARVAALVKEGEERRAALKKTPTERLAKLAEKAAPRSAPAIELRLRSLVEAFKALDENGDKLLEYGRKNTDQLFRSLLPLYAQERYPTDDHRFPVSGGDVSRFWARHGVDFHTSNAGKAWLQNVGYTRRVKGGVVITPNGVKYVEAACEAKKEAA